MSLGPFDPSVFLTAHGWIQLSTLTVLEIVLGIDNIIIISILSGELPKHQQATGRRLGLALAMITRVALLLTISWITHLTVNLFTLGDFPITGRGLVLVLGGLYLIWKSASEVWQTVELIEQRPDRKRKKAALWTVVTQIVLIDIVFSLDSVITAVGMSNEILIMVLAVIIAVLIMLVASGFISDFVAKHPTVKVLALSFLLVVGLVLVFDGIAPEVAEAWHAKSYVYAAMFFSVAIEVLNLRMKRNTRRLQGD